MPLSRLGGSSERTGKSTVARYRNDDVVAVEPIIDWNHAFANLSGGVTSHQAVLRVAVPENSLQLNATASPDKSTATSSRISNQTDLAINNTSSSSSSSGTFIADFSNPFQAAVIFCLGWVFLSVLCYCSFPTIPSEAYRRERQVFFERRARERRRRLRRLERLADPAWRRAAIERSLTVQRIVSADEQGNLTLGEPLTNLGKNEGSDNEANHQEDESSHTSSYHSMEDGSEESTCVICLEPFRVGDVVAWTKRPYSLGSQHGHSVTISSSSDSAASVLANQQQEEEEADCLHVFHRDCIVPWLENKHDDCPSCRKVILQLHNKRKGADETQTDLEHGNHDDEEDDDSSSSSSVAGEEYNNNAESGLFVIMHGLVSRARRASYSLIGESINVINQYDSMPRVDDISADDDVELNSLASPSHLRRVNSTGRTMSFRRFERSNSFIPKRAKALKQPSLSIENNDIPPALQLRRVVSVGPGASPRRSKAQDVLRDQQRPTHLENDESIAPPRPSQIIPLKRVSSSSSTVTRRFTHSKGNYECLSERSIDELDDDAKGLGSSSMPRSSQSPLRPSPLSTPVLTRLRAMVDWSSSRTIVVDADMDLSASSLSHRVRFRKSSFDWSEDDQGNDSHSSLTAPFRRVSGTVPSLLPSIPRLRRSSRSSWCESMSGDGTVDDVPAFLEQHENLPGSCDDESARSDEEELNLMPASHRTPRRESIGENDLDEYGSDYSSKDVEAAIAAAATQLR